DDAFQRGGDEEWLEAKVQQSGDGAGGVVGMQRGEDQMAGERGLHGNFGGFFIADFADENDVGVLTQHRAENAAEGQFDLGLDLALNDSVDVIFDGVFGGDQLAGDVVELAESGIERGGFTGTGGTGHDSDAVGLFDELTEGIEIFFAQYEH